MPHRISTQVSKLSAANDSVSTIFVGLCFWTKSELDEKNEYERVAFPQTVPEMIKIKKDEALAKKERFEARQQEISKNLLKLDLWKKDILARKEKKELVSSTDFEGNTNSLRSVLGCKSCERPQRSAYRGSS